MNLKRRENVSGRQSQKSNYGIAVHRYPEEGTDELSKLRNKYYDIRRSGLGSHNN